MDKKMERYYKAYQENEYNANKHMSYAHAFTAFMLFVVWILYFIPNVFRLTYTSRVTTLIALGIIIVMLLLPLFYVKKTNKAHKPSFKYYVLMSFVFIMGVLNVIIPKHAMIGWAIGIILANHYYNPKLGRVVFITTLIGMFVCIYLGMFLGEYDPNLLMGELDETVGNGVIHHFADYSITFEDTIQGRYEYLHFLLGHGYNRYLAAFIYYYLSRALVITIIFFVSNSLNRRTYKLLVDEIKVGSELASQSKELEIAGEIQLSVLPESFRTSKDVEIIANLNPTKEVGGDFYDYYKLDDKHVAILIGDVSGKGSPAAMFMMKTITCFKNFVDVNKTPSKIIKEVNRAIYQGNTNNMFVTCFFGILDIETGVLKFANAGHNPPLIGHFGDYHYLKCSTGFVLGGLEEAFVRDEETKLEKGDSITLYTDGITEARNEKGDFYGEERLLNVFNRRLYDTIIDLHFELQDDIATFVGGADQADDITYITLKYKGGLTEYRDVYLESKQYDVSKVVDACSEMLGKQNTGDALEKVQKIAEEVLSNIAKYAYQDREGEIYFRITRNQTNKVISLTFIDKGADFNQLEFDENNRILKQTMDDASYFRINGKNILVVRINY